MRRVTVWDKADWDNRMWKAECTINYEGWLVQILETTGSYGTGANVIVVNQNGRMQAHDIRLVQLHGPHEIPLLHGAPRRGDMSENGAAPTAACTEEC